MRQPPNTHGEECVCRLVPQGAQTTRTPGCAPGGRFAIGSGNSIPDYVPVENLLTMLDEVLKT